MYLNKYEYFKLNISKNMYHKTEENDSRISKHKISNLIIKSTDKRLVEIIDNFLIYICSVPSKVLKHSCKS